MPGRRARGRADHDDAGAEKPELLADHREDEVVVRVRQRDAGCCAEPSPEQAADAERQQALDRVVPVAERVGPGVQKADAVHLVAAQATGRRPAGAAGITPRGAQLPPATKNIVSAVRPMTTVVPRSGS